MPILRDDEIAKEVEKWRLEINTLNKLFSGLILKAKLQAELVKLARGTVYFVYGKDGSGISSINASIESPLQVSVSGHRDNVSALSAARVAWHDQRNSSKINRNRNYIPSPGEQEGPGGGQDDNLLDALANVPEGFVWPSVNQKKIEISNIPGSHGSLGIRNLAIANGKRYGGSRVEEELKRRGPK
ncbi:hypothetical protein NW760_004360 [Fusarium oxysporum]|uniref:Uncharacterized protein n=1 Tax=Fusarium oxysporum f. sp. raphani TaxID=96318 RepID=A0A8J5PYD0_FUSOX|nr:hypothetical protein Forpi1262_v010714 [Fusarium oxysporum f. sp. raphani]KAJ4083629.1 hypothetical protein NW769_014610 [Fusarium oxysporum]KAJ4234854.1 hypothetical protein NW760_004360 [Fusarium oxysporum]